MQKPTTRHAATFGRTAAEVKANAAIEEQVRLRAYELYESRGRGDGHDVEDWLAAEAEITSTTERAAA